MRFWNFAYDIFGVAGDVWRWLWKHVHCKLSAYLNCVISSTGSKDPHPPEAKKNNSFHTVDQWLITLKVKMTFSDERYKIFSKEINVSFHREESIDAVHICNARLLLLLFPLASKCYLWKLLYTSVIFLSSCIFWKRYYLFTMSGLDCRKGNSWFIVDALL